MTRLSWTARLLPLAVVATLAGTVTDGCQGPDTFLRETSPGVGGDSIDPIGVGGSGDGYSATGVGPCSACHDNDSQLGAKCTMMIDCLAATSPVCTTPNSPNNCWPECRNKAGGSGVLETCVRNLVTAYCM